MPYEVPEPLLMDVIEVQQAAVIRDRLIEQAKGEQQKSRNYQNSRRPRPSR